MLAIWPELTFIKMMDFIFTSAEGKPTLWMFTDLEFRTQIKDISHLDLGEVIRTFLINIVRQKSLKTRQSGSPDS